MLDAEDPMRTVDDSYYEAYVLEASAGTDVVIRLESDDFDPYLVLVAPSGEIEDSNDDAEEGDLNSLLEATLSEGGQWLIVANTLEPGETGAYRLTVSKKVRPR
jgi:serine protease Do